MRVGNKRRDGGGGDGEDDDDEWDKETGSRERYYSRVACLMPGFGNPDRRRVSWWS